MEIVQGDILKTDLVSLTQEKLTDLELVACANLPYNITSSAISTLLEAGCFKQITVMVQREVAQRICAVPGSKDYGAFSVYCQYHACPELLFDVPPESFIPAPKITSSVLQLRPIPAPEDIDDPNHFFRVVRAVFAQRRKTLLNGLTAGFSPELTRQQIQSAVSSCGLSPEIRGERLGIPEFSALSHALRNLG